MPLLLAAILASPVSAPAPLHGSAARPREPGARLGRPPLAPRPFLDSGPAPDPREFAAAAWDSERQAVLLYGGWTSVPSDPFGGAAVNVTWTFANGTWTRVDSSAPPPDPVGASLADDPSLGAPVLFGGAPCLGSAGCLANASNATWTFGGTGWTEWHGGPAPPARIGATLSYDPAFGGDVLFGGLTPGRGAGGSPVPLNDTWVFANDSWSNWTARVGPAPHPRWQAAAAYDPNLEGLFLFGGSASATDATPALNGTFELTPAGWRTLPITSGPTAVAGGAMSFVTAFSAIVLFGGLADPSLAPAQTTWALSDGNWSALAPGAVPPGRWLASFVDDPVAHLGLLVGGDNDSSGVAPPYAPLNGSWGFASDNWTTIGPVETGLPPSGGAIAYDAADRDVVYYSAGYAGEELANATTYTFHAGVWSLDRASPEPPARVGAAMAYDAALGYVLLFGGRAANASETYLNDTWAFSGGSWRELTPAVAPPARANATLVDDAADGYLLLLGGVGPVLYNDSWVWNGTTWAPAPGPATTPFAPGDGPAAAYDAADGYVVAVDAAHTRCVGVVGPCLQTFTYRNGSWTNRTDAAEAPIAADGVGLTEGGPNGSLLLFGGACIAAKGCFSGQYLNQTWTYAGGDWSPWTAGKAPNPRATPPLADDLADGYVLLYGGLGPIVDHEPSATADTWTFANDTWTELAPTLVVSPSPVDVNATAHLAVLGVPVAPGFGFFFYDLPDGCLSIDSAGLACTPTAAGTYPVLVLIEYSDTVSAYSSATLLVVPRPAVLGFAANLTDLAVGSSTRFTVMVADGVAPFSFAYSDLPPGCSSLNTSSLACVPTAVGRYSVTVRVTDACGENASATLVLTVVAATPPGGEPVQNLPMTPAPSLSPAVLLAILLAVPAGVAVLALLWARRRRSPPRSEVPPPTAG